MAFVAYGGDGNMYKPLYATKDPGQGWGHCYTYDDVELWDDVW